MKLALIQITSRADVAENIRRMAALVERAVKKGAQFIATPENTFEMQEPGKPRALFTLDKHPGVKAAGEMAKKHKLWLLIGSVNVIPAEAEGPLRKKDPSAPLRSAQNDKKKTHNRSLLFNPQGKLVASYDKIHLFDVEVGDGQVYKESAKIIPGDRTMLAKTPLGKLGMTVCYDVRFPQLYRALAKAGAEILAVPAAFTKVTGEAHWHVLLRARAIENGCFVIAPAQTGTHPGGRKTFGHSLVVDPWGRVLADGGTKEGIVMADIDLGEVKKARERIPSLKHDRRLS